MDGSIMTIMVTEKNGLSLGTELEVEEFCDSAVTKENKEVVSRCIVTNFFFTDGVNFSYKFLESFFFLGYLAACYVTLICIKMYLICFRSSNDVYFLIILIYYLYIFF